MNRLLSILLLLCCSPFLSAQTNPDTTQTKYGMTGSFGTVLIGGNSYTEVRLLPEIAFGKVGVGLDVDLLIDPDGRIRKEDWDQFSDYLAKIYYVRYGQRGDPFFARIGGFPSYTLGHGLVMSDYTNMLRYPQYRQIGLQIGLNSPFRNLGFEVFTSNLAQNDIIAARIQATPFDQTQIPYVNQTVFGVTLATDRNQLHGLIDTDNDDYPDAFDDYPTDRRRWNRIDEEIGYYRDLYVYDHGDTVGFAEYFQNAPGFTAQRHHSFDDLGKTGHDVTVLGFDYTTPILTMDYFTLSHYGEMAHITEHKNGFIFPGFYSKFMIFEANLEFRFYQEDFEPAFFDRLYEENRAFVVGDTVLVKSDMLWDNPSQHGWFASLTTHLLSMFYLKAAYEDMYSGESDDNGKSLWASAWIQPGLIPRLSTARIDYSQSRVEHVLEHLRTPTTYLSGKAGWAISPGTDLYCNYQERYVDADGDGEIHGVDEVVKTITFGVQLKIF
jgi:hypothetical protein